VELDENLVSWRGAMSGCKIITGAGVEQEQEVAERETECRAGVTEIGLSGERKICRSRSAHMLWSPIADFFVGRLETGLHLANVFEACTFEAA